MSRQIKKYTIRAYSDIDSLMEKGWHWRGLNQSGDYCYVILDSVEFYLYCKKPLKIFYPDGSCCNRDQGYGLVFTLSVEMASLQVLEQILMFFCDVWSFSC